MFSDYENNRRRSSSRAIKRPKFDDELVESSLGTQNNPPLYKVRTRNPSLSTASDCSSSLPATSTAEIRKKQAVKSTRKVKKNKLYSAVTKDLGRWKPTDDLALIIGVQQTCDLVPVHKGIKFSCKFTLAEIQERWYALLYDSTVSRVAQQAMRNLHPEQIQAVQEKALYSKAEEDLLGTIKSDSKPTLEIFQILLEDNASTFYIGRTAKALSMHWNLLKKYCLLPDQSVTLEEKIDINREIAEAEQQANENDVNESEELLSHELDIVGRGVKKEIRLLEEETSRWQVVVDSVTGISAPDFDSLTLAVLRGRIVRYLMRSKEITIGRKSAGNEVDVDLSLEGPAWKISRKQAVIKLKGVEFLIVNEGKRPLIIDGKPVLTGGKAKLHSNSVIEIGSLRLIFLINQEYISNLRK